MYVLCVLCVCVYVCMHVIIIVHHTETVLKLYDCLEYIFPACNHMYLYSFCFSYLKAAPRQFRRELTEYFSHVIRDICRVYYKISQYIYNV